MQINPDVIVGKTTEHLVASGEFAGVLHQQAVQPFAELVSRAATAGFDLRILSGFRSFQRQLGIWNAKARGERAVLDDMNCEIDLSKMSELEKIQAIMRFSAIPGGSRHHWGTDIDVYDARSMSEGYQVQLTYSETQGSGPFADLHRWLDSELPNTDFYRPYGLDLGGVAIEPWHLSYRPQADIYARAFNTDLLSKAHRGVEIELFEGIESNMDALFERFIQVD